MTIPNYKVKLSDIQLQVEPNGIKATNATIIDDQQPWLSRQKLLTQRSDEGKLAFEVQTLTGRRVVISYSSAAMPTIPTLNNENLSSIYKKYVEYGYQISGTTLPYADAVTLYNKYKEQQLLWAKRQFILLQINDPDIGQTTLLDLLDKLAQTYADLNTAEMDLTMMGNTYKVVFAEGNSFQVSDWVAAPYMDFSFSLIHRILLTI